MVKDKDRFGPKAMVTKGVISQNGKSSFWKAL
jgi:hypothetical protein